MQELGASVTCASTGTTLTRCCADEAILVTPCERQLNVHVGTDAALSIAIPNDRHYLGTPQDSNNLDCRWALICTNRSLAMKIIVHNLTTERYFDHLSIFP